MGAGSAAGGEEPNIGWWERFGHFQEWSKGWSAYCQAR